MVAESRDGPARSPCSGFGRGWTPWLKGVRAGGAQRDKFTMEKGDNNDPEILGGP